MLRKSIVAKLWVSIVSILAITLLIAGLGLFKIVDNFYYSQITKNITYQGKQIAALYEKYPDTFKNSDEINRFSHIINAHTVILDEKGIIQVCNASTHLSPGTVFMEKELSRIFQGETIVKTSFYEHFEAEMLTIGVPVHKSGQISEALLIYTPVEPISTTLNSLRILLISTSIGFIILASILAFFLSRSLSRPLIRMNQVALSLAQGDFEQRVTVNSSDEIGVLGASLNYLSGQLKGNITELSLEKEKIENILIGMSDGVITIDTNGRIILANPQAEKLLDKRLILEKGSSFKDSEDLGQLIALYREVLETKEQTRGEIKVGEKMISVRLSPLFEMNSDKMNGLIIVLQDITKERKLEEMRREFVANVSHELRTPITLIKGYAEAMTDIAESPEQQEKFAQTIYDEANRLKRLVEDLLELSRLDSGVITLEKESIDLEKLFAQLKSRFGGVLKDNNILLESQIDAKAKSIFVDRFRFEQILINLIDNAIRYSSGRSVQLTSRKVTEGVEIRIKDTGNGIAEEDLPYVFERFYRVDKSRNRESGGIGLGLSIVKNLVEAHGGNIKVESTLGVGTTFVMFLPDSHILTEENIKNIHRFNRFDNL